MATKIVITIDTMAEDETPEHSEKVTKSAPGYAQGVRKMLKTAEGRWGWCIVRVTAKATDPGGEKAGIAYLGNCSYKNAEDFASNSGYLRQMVEEAIQEMAKS